MKQSLGKISSAVLIGAWALTNLSYALPAHGQINLDPPGLDTKLPRGGSNAQKTVGDTIIKVINIMLSFSAFLAVGAIIWGALNMILSAGDDSKVKNGKKIITWAIIGLLLTGFSFLIVQFIGNSLIRK